MTQSLLALLALVAIASISSCIIYFPFRFIERKSQFLAAIFNIFVLSILILYDFSRYYKIVFTIVANFIFIVIFFSLLGGMIHIKSGGTSRNFYLAFLMMFLITSSVLLIVSFSHGLFSLETLSLFTGPNWYVRRAARTLMIAQAITPPFLFWVWESFRLRPGIDKPFEEEDKARNSNSHQV